MASPWEQAKAGKKISAPKQSKYHGYQGQAGGSSSIPSQGKRDAFVQLQRQKFFGDRDVPEERVLKRTSQEGLMRQYKDALVKQGKYVTDSQGNPVKTASGDYVYTGTSYFDTDSSSPTFGRHVTYGVNDKMQELAMKYGPTPGEIFGDIGYGLGSIAKGFAEKGTPLMQLFKGLGQEVKNAWDKVRGEPTSVEGTAFPQPGSDTKELFSSIDTGIAQIDPDNMLANIARQNQYEDIPFDQLLSNATAQNLNVPNIGDILETASDYTDAYLGGVNLNTPIGTVNLNPAKESIFLQNQLKNLPINYSASYTPGSDQATGGIQMALPKDFMLSGGTNFEGDGGLGLSKSYNSFIRGVNDITPYVSTNLDQSRAGVNVGFDPLAALGIPSSFGVPVNFGISTDQSGNITPRLEVNAPFGGLGYMFK